MSVPDCSLMMHVVDKMLLESGTCTRLHFQLVSFKSKGDSYAWKKIKLLFHALCLSKSGAHVFRISIYFTDMLNTLFWLVKGKLSEKHLLLWYIRRYLKLYFQGKKTKNLSCLLFTLQVRDNPVREAHLQTSFMPFPVVPVHVTALCKQVKRNSSLWAGQKVSFYISAYIQPHMKT